MYIKVNIKKSTKTGFTKDSAMPKAGCGGVVFSGYTSGGIVTSGGKYVLAYNLEKRRRKAGKPKHWVCNYYLIPVAILKVAGLRVDQYNRYFRIVKR